MKSGVTVFVESGPRGTLASLTRRIAQGHDVAIATTDDRDRPGRFALAKVKAMLETRRAVDAVRMETGPMDGMNGVASLTVLEGDAARALLVEDGFDAFWTRMRPTILSLIEGLWAAERGRPEAAPPPADDPVPVLEPVEEVESSFSIAGEPSPPFVQTAAVARADLEAFLIEAFSKETGYPPELIDVGADLEADLGIDTVKQAQVLGKVRDRFNLRTDEKLALRDFPTVGHIVRYVERTLSSAPAPKSDAPPKPSRVPMLDVSQRRSRPPKS
jgi:hypothetical protein